MPPCSVCQALQVYAFRLRQPQMAEDYCRDNYDRDKEGAQDVYLTLFQVLARACPPNVREPPLSS